MAELEGFENLVHAESLESLILFGLRWLNT
jgi:hypothetical protein